LAILNFFFIIKRFLTKKPNVFSVSSEYLIIFQRVLIPPVQSKIAPLLSLRSSRNGGIERLRVTLLVFFLFANAYEALLTIKTKEWIIKTNRAAIFWGFRPVH
jgi:hypothetical protein